MEWWVVVATGIGLAVLVPVAGFITVQVMRRKYAYPFAAAEIFSPRVVVPVFALLVLVYAALLAFDVDADLYAAAVSGALLGGVILLLIARPRPPEPPKE